MKSAYMLIVVCAFTIVKSDQNEGFEYPDDWVDPGDMFSFDPVSKQNIKQMAHVDHSQTFGDRKQETLPDVSSCPKCPDCTDCTKTNLQVSCPKCPDCPKCSETNLQQATRDIFFRRFVAVLIKKLQSVGKPPDYISYNVQLDLTERSWDLLTKFAEGSEVPVQDVGESLEEIIHFVSPGSKEWNSHLWWKFEDYFHMSSQDALTIGFLILVLVAGLCLEMFSQVSWTSQLKRLFILAFIISLPITFFHEYQVAVAEHKSKVSNIPEHCLRIEKHNSIYDDVVISLRHWFSTTKDPCLEYHEFHLIAPIIKVPPTKVLAVTMTRFFLEPLSHFGTTFSQTFRNMFSELPVQLWIPAFIFLIVIMIVGLMLFSVCFGYAWNVNLPFWSGIEIGPQRNLHAPRQMEQLMENQRQQLQVLQAAIERQNSQPTPALPAPPQPTETSSFLGSVLGTFGLGGRRTPTRATEQSNASQNLPTGPPYPTAPESNSQEQQRRNEMPTMPDVPQVRRRVNRPPYPQQTTTDFHFNTTSPTSADNFVTAFDCGDGPGDRSTFGDRVQDPPSPSSPRPDSPPPYSQVHNPLPYPNVEQGTGRPIGFEGIIDLPVTDNEAEQDSTTTVKTVGQAETHESFDDSDLSDIEVLSRDSPDERET